MKEVKGFGYRGTSTKGDEQIYRVQRSLGKALLLSGDFDQAELVFEKTLKSVSEQFGDDHELVYRICFNIAALKGKRKMWPDAIRLHIKALHAADLRSDNHTFLCQARRVLAHLYDLSGDIIMSEKNYRLAIACSIRASGHTHEMTITSLVALAEFFQKHGVYEDEAGSHRRALPILERLKTADKEQSVETIVDLLRLLTMALKLKGRLEEALSTSQQAVLLAANLPKPEVNHEHPFWTLVVEHLRSKDRYREAENIGRELWNQLREKNGPLHVDTVKVMKGVVSCLLHQNLLQDDKLLIEVTLQTRSKKEYYDLEAIVAVDRYMITTGRRGTQERFMAVRNKL